MGASVPRGYLKKHRVMLPTRSRRPASAVAYSRELHGEEPVLRAIGIILCVMGAALLVLAHLCSRYSSPGAADQLLLPPPPSSTRSFFTPRTAHPYRASEKS